MLSFELEECLVSNSIFAFLIYWFVAVYNGIIFFARIRISPHLIHLFLYLALFSSLSYLLASQCTSRMLPKFKGTYKVVATREPALGGGLRPFGVVGFCAYLAGFHHN